MTVLASNIEAMLSHHSDKNEEDKEGCQTHRLLNGGMETLAKQRLEDARSLASTGKYEDAKAVYQAVLPMLEAALGPESKEVAEAHTGLGFIASQQSYAFP